MEIRPVPPADRDQAMIDALLALWEASVRATHTFLSDGEIRQIAGFVPQALLEVPLLAVACDSGGKPAGFMGIAGEKLEMLFLAPERRGQGLGRELLQRGIAWGVRALDVNEQNPRARGFYEYMGFRATGRSETDGQGRPYPILSMSLARDASPCFPPCGDAGAAL